MRSPGWQRLVDIGIDAYVAADLLTSLGRDLLLICDSIDCEHGFADR